MKKERKISLVCAFGSAVNLILFFVKLYVGLSANSISIFSDSMNNLFDFLSCVLGAVCMSYALWLKERKMPFSAEKIQQLVSFVLSVAVVAVGFSFAYSSAERLMYPTPVWFSLRYFFIIIATALAKLLLYFFFWHQNKKLKSSVIKVMKTDSLTDFFVTAVVLVSFAVTRITDFSADAFAGIIISVFIIIQSVKLLKESVCGLLDMPEKQQREKFFELSERFEAEIESVRFVREADGKICAYVKFEENTAQESISTFADECLLAADICLNRIK